MSDVVWGTGYGNKRHLPAGPVPEDPRRGVKAACSEMVWLTAFSDQDNWVMTKTPCTRCAKKAGVVPCPTCHGAGTVTTT